MQEQAAQDVEELVEFGWLFSSGKFSAQWGIDRFLELLALGGSIDPERLAAEQLTKLSETMPAKAVECARKIVEADPDGRGVTTWREQARTTISFAPVFRFKGKRSAQGSKRSFTLPD